MLRKRKSFEIINHLILSAIPRWLVKKKEIGRKILNFISSIGSVTLNLAPITSLKSRTSQNPWKICNKQHFCFFSLFLFVSDVDTTTYCVASEETFTFDFSKNKNVWIEERFFSSLRFLDDWLPNNCCRKLDKEVLSLNEYYFN